MMFGLEMYKTKHRKALFTFSRGLFKLKRTQHSLKLGNSTCDRDHKEFSKLPKKQYVLEVGK